MKCVYSTYVYMNCRAKYLYISCYREESSVEKKPKKETPSSQQNTSNGSSEPTLAQQHHAATSAAMSTNTHMAHMDPNAYNYNYNQWGGYVSNPLLKCLKYTCNS